MDVGNPNFLGYTGYEIGLWAGGNKLVSSSDAGQIAPDPGSGLFEESILTYISGTDFVGQPLEIRLSAGGSRTAFDDVQLDASVVPIPPALLLFASSLAGIGMLTRRRFKLAQSQQ